MSSGAVCPRCGYDLCGEVARWEEACPLEGVCSECGLLLDWSTIFGEARGVRGFIEHERGALRLLWSIPRTWWLAMRPWVFWKKVTLHPPVRPRRAAGWAALVTLGIRFGASAVASLVLVGGLKFPRTPAMKPVGVGPLELVAQTFAGDSAVSRPGSNWRYWGVGTLDIMAGIPVACLAAWLAWVVPLLLFGPSRSLAKVRAAHVIRAAAYSTAPLVMLHVVRALGAPARAIAMLLGQSWDLSVGSLEWTPQYGPPPPPFFSVLQGIDRVDAVLSSRWSLEVTALYLLWLAVWWNLAIHRGWRLRLPVGVNLVLNAAPVVIAGSICMNYERVLVLFW